MSEVVYVALDRAGQVLYVGATQDLDRRLAEHRRSSVWWPLAVEVEQYPHVDRQTALYVERNLIRRISPPYNTQSTEPTRRLANLMFGQVIRDIGGFESGSAA